MQSSFIDPKEGGWNLWNTPADTWQTWQYIQYSNSYYSPTKLISQASCMAYRAVLGMVERKCQACLCLEMQWLISNRWYGYDRVGRYPDFHTVIYIHTECTKRQEHSVVVILPVTLLSRLPWRSGEFCIVKMVWMVHWFPAARFWFNVTLQESSPYMPVLCLSMFSDRERHIWQRVVP